MMATKATNVGQVNGQDNTDAGESEWVRAHRALSRLAKQRARTDAEEGRWLLAALRSAAHVHAGFGGFGEYIGQLFGYSPRLTQDKLRVAEALEGLPRLAEALEVGVLNWSALRELTRVVTAETENQWLEVVRGKSARQVEALVVGMIPGDAPNAPPQLGARRHVLRFEVRADTYATFREATSQLRRTSDARLDDDALLLSLARAVLGGPRDEGRAGYQIVLDVCAECGRGAQLAAGEPIAVEPAVIAMAECDAQHIAEQVRPIGNGNDNDNDAAGHSERGSGECRQEQSVGEPLSSPAAAESETRIEPYPPPAEPANDTLPATDRSRDAHVGAPAPRARARRGVSLAPRATQTIPPALRRQVLLRERRCCSVPGCNNHRFLDLHHIQPRAEGGPNTAENIIVLCGAHHRAVHRGELLLQGSGASDLRYRHADGSLYGEPSNPRALDAYAKVFSALENLGFREPEVRGVLDALRQEPASAGLGLEALLREALQRMTSQRMTQRSRR